LEKIEKIAVSVGGSPPYLSGRPLFLENCQKLGVLFLKIAKNL